MASSTIRPASTLNDFMQYGNTAAQGAGGAYTTLHPNVQYGNLSTVTSKKAQTNGPSQPSKRPATTVQSVGPQNVPAPTAAPAAPPVSPYDYSSDPVLQAIRAGGIKRRATAEAAALAGRKQLAIQLGDASGIVDDKGTAEAAKANPFSSLAEIMRGYERTVDDTDENLNKANLFYSGHRGVQLGRILEDRQRQEYGARGAAQDRMTGISRELTSVLEQAALADAQAEAEAKDRALQQALLYGFDPGAGAPIAAPAAQPLSPAAPASALPAAAYEIDPWLRAAMGRRTA